MGSTISCTKTGCVEVGEKINQIDINEANHIRTLSVYKVKVTEKHVQNI